jgi:hydrogenase maturation protein HypF
MPVLRAAADDVLSGTPTATIAARFHHAVADLVADVAVALRDQTMINTVALSGGVFLNVLLTGLCVDRLLDRDFRVLRHSEVPPSDAGIALGQLVIGAQISGGRG